LRSRSSKPALRRDTPQESEDIINPKYTKNPIPATFIAQLPVLADLTIGSLGEELEDVKTLLEGLPPH
jgi:hypothetical protein